MIKVPYCLRVTEEQEDLSETYPGIGTRFRAVCAGNPETLARFSVMSRLRKHENSTLFAKVRVYDGESLMIRSEGPQRPGIQAMLPASTKAWTASRRALHSRL